MFWIMIAGLALWLAGGWFGVSAKARAIVLGLFYLALLAVVGLAPGGAALGSLAAWLMLGAVVLVVLVYRAGLRWLRARARPVPEASAGPAPLFTEAELERYGRHIVLRELGGPGQKKLKEARVLVIGAGGLGAPALLYLAAAGVGEITVLDPDQVERSNLQRQVLFREGDIGRSKVEVAAEVLRAQNPHVTLHPLARRFTQAQADLLEGQDLVLDGTDNFDTRYLVNRLAVAAGIPLVSGALSQWEGQLSVFHPAGGTPCYQCIFPEAPAPGLAPSCAEAGVLGPLPGVVGAAMAVEAIKLITGAGAALKGEMMIHDALWGETRKIAMKPRPDCPVCGAGNEVTI